MLPLLHLLLAPFFSLLFLSMASGLFTTFVSIRLEIETFDTESIGVVTSSLYLGILLGSLFVSRYIVRWGHVRSHILFALFSAVAVLLQALWIDPYYWSFLRFMSGVAMAGIFITMESWFLIQAGPHLRSAVLSLYLATFYGALSLGQLLVQVADPHSYLPFYLTALLCTLSCLPLLHRRVNPPKLEPHPRLKLRTLFRISPFGFLGGIASGIVLAAVHGLVPLYAKGIGLTLGEISNLMAIVICGGLFFQWPIGRWADKTKNRRPILIFASLCTALTGIGIGLLEQHFSFLLLGMIFLFGGFSFTIYPLSMAYTCENISQNQIVPATGGFVLSYGIGAIAGPLLAPLAMKWLGAVGLFYFLALIAILLVLAGLRRAPIPDRDT